MPPSPAPTGRLHPADAPVRPSPGETARRVAIERVVPEVDAGRFAAKHILGDDLVVEADVFTDGHDTVRAVLLYRGPQAEGWTETPMEPLVNDRYRGHFVPGTLGLWHFTVVAWVDRFRTWRSDLLKRQTAESVEPVDLADGARLVADAATRAALGTGDAAREDTEALERSAQRLVARDRPLETRTLDALDPTLLTLMDRWADRSAATQYRHTVPLQVDPERARASAWYELFPRSTTDDPKGHGTLRTTIDRLPYVAAMGFDVLYLPPIHPIGHAARKGPNNAVRAGSDDPGSPWAIGSPDGGHTEIHPELGTIHDFDALVAACTEHGIDLALDLAFQCSPDHPWVKEHPQWFKERADGSIQYAENPPKKYQDIYPIDFETEDWQALWEALGDVVQYWCDRGVRIFRVDNPHTKPFPFWEWLIQRVRGHHPETLFLAEAFTRPKVMHRLAKLGFTHSYTYFAWRNQKWEIEQYFKELTQTEVRHFFRPHLWPNTPDILTEYLQYGGRGAFMTRFVLAATLGANYGIYGPALELMEHQPRGPGSEEYLDSEKYQIRHWNLDRPDSLRPFITRINRIRKAHPALRHDASLHFHPVDNSEMIAYSKRAPEGTDTLLMVVNLDPHHHHASWLHLDMDALGLVPDETFQVHDLITDARYMWHGPHNYVALDPASTPAHILRIRRRARNERDFDYYL